MASSRLRLNDGIMSDLKRVAEERQSVLKPACMFPVEMLVNVKPELYAPRVISLGLFNRSPSDAPKTRADQCRLEMACAFLEVMGMKEGDEDDWNKLCRKVVPNPKEMRDLYDGIGRQADPLSDEEVQSALTLDAIFVACFAGDGPGIFEMRKYFPAFERPMALIQDAVGTNIMLDILNVQNQIPITLVENTLRILFEQLDETARVELGDEDHASMVLRGICGRMGSFLEFFIPGFDFEEPLSIRRGVSYDFPEYNNLLDFAHRWVLRQDLPLRPATENGLSCACFKKIRNGLSKSVVFSCSCYKVTIKDASEVSSELVSITIPSVARLQEAGIEFRGFKGTFHDVRFTRGLFKATLHLPQMYIDELVLPVWRHLAAYEQLLLNDVNRSGKSGEFTCFLHFMDNLIDDENDVLLLRKGKHPTIRENWLGNNKDVARAFNGILENYLVDERDTKWSLLKKEILEYYEKVPRRLYVEFIQTNFGKPWFIFSILAAMILIVATILQTVFTILGYYQ